MLTDMAAPYFDKPVGNYLCDSVAASDVRFDRRVPIVSTHSLNQEKMS